ncbi:family 16 glycosylhydrolase [Kutzneria sp. 744]|uniref:glycoside hydrolase family 16 protein n=1 Tax=Kutzneria sp. (strain 744) TaxID=345341 RepID=UPI001E3827A3|nr:family 16 glycosylhydrolase [Kutzneria sp. 744]
MTPTNVFDQQRRSSMQLRTTRRGLLLAAAAGLAVTLASPPSISHAAPAQTVLSGSFANTSTLQANWDYLYPWGSDHNGSARMSAGQVSASGGVLTLTANKITKDEGTSSSPPHLHINYHSGAVHAKQQVTVSAAHPSWDVSGQFQAPAVRGAWPAFWLTAVNGWPPESDILEFKGQNTNWFNTFRTSSDVSTTKVSVSSPGSWHTYRAVLTKVSATDVDIHYYFDGVQQGVHHATGFVDKPMWIIINLQMEGSSGSPGPGGATVYRARNVVVSRT